MKKSLLFLCIGFILPCALFAQTDTAGANETIDFSQFADMAPAEGVKRYCTSKVLDLSPNKLVSLGYDFQGPHTLTTGFGKQEIRSVSGMRLSGNIPVVSKTTVQWAVGFSHWQSFYDISENNTDAFTGSLAVHGLSTTGLNSTLFKPLNEKNFLLVFISADMNGNYQLNSRDMPDFLNKTRYTAAAFYGWKRNDRSMLALGVSRTYRPGAQGYIPLVLFNHTFENRKWGIESLFPARAAVRRTLTTRNILLAGYELEGNSYHLLNRNNGFGPGVNDLELRRSELRFRLTYEFAVYRFLWISVQTGYRVNYNFNIDRGEFFRSLFDDKSYLQENKLTNPLYFNLSLNLVSP